MGVAPSSSGPVIRRHNFIHDSAQTPVNDQRDSFAPETR